MKKLIFSIALYPLNKLRTAFIMLKYNSYYEVFKKFSTYTMTPGDRYVLNLLLAEKFFSVNGSIVECGTWRGGMIAGIAKIASADKKIYLFDSYEGMPEPKAPDGQEAIDWQNDKTAPGYFDNCKAEVEFAHRAMELSGNKNYVITKGWFSDTLPLFKDKAQPISVLRIDGDWYESTMDCLDNLYDLVSENGVIIIDDYYFWNGCAKAVHDFLSKRQLPDKIYQWHDDVCYIIKSKKS